MTLRQKKFLEELPKHNNKIMPTAVAVGYKESYARSRGKTLLQNAVKSKAKGLVKTLEENTLTKQEGLKLMSEIVGLSSETLMERIRFIATQDKDLSSALKVLIPLLKQHNVVLAEENANKTIVPVLNISVKERNNGLIEPPNSPEEV